MCIRDSHQTHQFEPMNVDKHWQKTVRSQQNAITRLQMHNKRLIEDVQQAHETARLLNHMINRATRNMALDYVVADRLDSMELRSDDTSLSSPRTMTCLAQAVGLSIGRHAESLAQTALRTCQPGTYMLSIDRRWLQEVSARPTHTPILPAPHLRLLHG